MNFVAPIIGVGLAGIGGASIIYFGLNHTPNALSIAEVDSKEFKDKFGEDFKHHLVAANKPENDLWWKWNFDNIFSEEDDSVRGEEFKKAKVASSRDLMRICELAYKLTTKTEIHNQEKQKPNYEKDVWRYCSKLGSKPIVLSEVEDYENKDDVSADNEKDDWTIGQKEHNKLVSVKDPRNEMFWKIQQEAFENQKFVLDDGNSKGLFKHTIRKLGGSKSARVQEFVDLKTACKRAYKVKNEESEVKKLTMKWCSLQVQIEQTEPSK